MNGRLGPIVPSEASRVRIVVLSAECVVAELFHADSDPDRVIRSGTLVVSVSEIAFAAAAESMPGVATSPAVHAIAMKAL